MILIKIIINDLVLRLDLNSSGMDEKMDLRNYLEELNKIRLLEQEEELELWKSYKQKNDLSSRELLISSYQPLIFKVVTQLHLNDSLLMDVIQEGTVGLIEAVERYEYERGVAFSLYATHRIRGRMLNFIQKEYKRNLTYIDNPMYNEDCVLDWRESLVDDALPVCEQVEDHVLMEQIKSAVSRLPQKEQLVIDSVYLKEQETKTIAQNMELSTTHIYRLQKQGIRRIRGMLSKFMQHW